MEKASTVSRVVVSGLWVFAVVVAFMLTMEGITPAGAQSSATARVSTLDEASAGPFSIRGGQQYAQSFCTGDSDVTFSKVRLATRTSGELDPTLTIRADTSGSPGATIDTLINPATSDNDISTNEDFTSSGVELDANTRYWLVISSGQRSPSLNVDLTRSKVESSAEAGWSIGDKMLYRGSGGWPPAFASSEPSGYRMRMVVYAIGDAPSMAPPVFGDRDCTGDADPLTLRVDENTAGGGVVGTVMATDPDNDSLTYSVTGADIAEFNQVFAINNGSGEITVKSGASPNYEGKSSYSITVNVTDGKDASGNTEDPAVTDDSVTVTVRINNLDEMGTITLSPETPAVGSVLNANLTDPDGGLLFVRVRWHKADTATGPFTLIGGNNSKCSAQGCFVPSAEDQGKFLKVTMIYYDGASGPRNSRGNLIISSSNPTRDRRTLEVTSSNAVAVGGL